MKKLQLLKPLPWTIQHATSIWQSKDVLPDSTGKYPLEIRKEIDLISG